ncbi:MAG: glycosyltransferase family 9 protein [Ignavibacteriaceae bacterium]|nr:glycosyltransferase family 9 protein [Ignavibacteriaceae bacterium]
MNNLIKVKIFVSNLISQIIIILFSRDQSPISNKLLVINTEKLGDLIISADFLYSIGVNGYYEECDLLISEKFSSLFDWKELRFNCISINKNKYRYNLLYRLKIIFLIRRNRYSHVINITQERGMINEELTFISGVKRKTAIKGTSLYLPNIILSRNNKLYADILDVPGKNEYERLSYYLSKNKIGLVNNNNIFGDEQIPLNVINSKLKAKNFIIIAPMSSELDKSWGINNYKQLCSILDDDVVLLGKEEERNKLDSICAGRNNIINMGGRLSFKQIAVLMRYCNLYIGNDSGLTHFAHQFNTPLIAIIGGGKYGKFFPYKEREDAVFLYDKMECFGCDWNCIHDKKYCLINVTPESVLETISLFYKSKKGGSGIGSFKNPVI